MKQEQTLHRRAIGLLLAAVALPITPVLAQDAAPPTEPPIVDVTPPPVATPVPETIPTAPTIVTAPPPVITTRPVVTSPPPTIEAAPTRQRTTTRTTRTIVTPQRGASPARTAAPAAAAPAPAAEATPPLAATPPVAAPAPEALPVETAPAADTAPANPNWTLIAAGAAALLAAMLALFAWRRRRVPDEAPREVYEERTVFEEPPAPIAEPLVAAPAAFAAAETVGEPQIEFEMRPVRAGVGDEDARVDFELAVANRGTAPARDVRVTAWMLGDGSPHESEMENALIERVDIEAGEDANVEASVGFPRAGLSEDAILPVVVTEARYRLPDGSEGRTTASYAVGVPDGDEMIYFDVENPSGLHGGVVAREVDELERA
jgi:MYXO-CTERM domain-containing protein